MQKTNILKKSAVLFTGLSLLFVMALVSCNNEASTTTETLKDSVVTPVAPDTTLQKQAVPDTPVIDTSKTGQNPPPPKN